MICGRGINLCLSFENGLREPMVARRRGYKISKRARLRASRRVMEPALSILHCAGMAVFRQPEPSHWEVPPTNQRENLAPTRDFPHQILNQGPHFREPF